jgi:hypothetical protein
MANQIVEIPHIFSFGSDILLNILDYCDIVSTVRFTSTCKYALDITKKTNLFMKNNKPSNPLKERLDIFRDLTNQIRGYDGIQFRYVDKEPPIRDSGTDFKYAHDLNGSKIFNPFPDVPFYNALKFSLSEKRLKDCIYCYKLVKNSRSSGYTTTWKREVSRMCSLAIYYKLLVFALYVAGNESWYLDYRHAFLHAFFQDNILWQKILYDQYVSYMEPFSSAPSARLESILTYEEKYSSRRHMGVISAIELASFFGRIETLIYIVSNIKKNYPNFEKEYNLPFHTIWSAVLSGDLRIIRGVNELFFPQYKEFWQNEELICRKNLLLKELATVDACEVIKILLDKFEFDSDTLLTSMRRCIYYGNEKLLKIFMAHKSYALVRENAKDLLYECINYKRKECFEYIFKRSAENIRKEIIDDILKRYPTYDIGYLFADDTIHEYLLDRVIDLSSDQELIYACKLVIDPILKEKGFYELKKRFERNENTEENDPKTNQDSGKKTRKRKKRK